MSHRAKRELLVQVFPRYQAAGHAQKSVILDEFLAATGYDRKYAIRLLSTEPALPPGPIHRPRASRYGPEVVEALHLAWSALNEICSTPGPLPPRVGSHPRTARTFAPHRRGASPPAHHQPGHHGPHVPSIPSAAWNQYH